MNSIAELDPSWMQGMEEVFACQQNQNIEALNSIGKEDDGATEKVAFSNLPEAASFTQAIMNVKDSNDDGMLTMDEVNNDMLFKQLDMNADEEISQEELSSKIKFEVQQFGDVLELLQPNADLSGTSKLSELMGNDAKPSTAMFKQLMQQAS